MFQAKQELKSVPFQILHEKVTLAGRRAVESLMKNEEEAYSRMIARKEKEWVDRHEYPDEGAIREEYPFIGPSEDILREEKVKAEQAAFKETVAYLKLKEKAMWLLPQVTAYIANMALPRRPDGKVDALEFLKANFRLDDWHRGLYRYCTAYQRGLIVPSQYSETYRNYSALVPLLMMPFKKFDGIGYEQWDHDNHMYSDQVAHALDPQLALAMTVSPLSEEIDYEEILETRSEGLKVKTGPKAGTSRNPVSTCKLYGIEGQYTLGNYPWLVQVMEAQIWMAHPSVRTNLMVLDSDYWDNIPKALIDTEVIDKATKIENATRGGLVANDLEWDI